MPATLNQFGAGGLGMMGHQNLTALNSLLTGTGRGFNMQQYQAALATGSTIPMTFNPVQMAAMNQMMMASNPQLFNSQLMSLAMPGAVSQIPVIPLGTGTQAAATAGAGVENASMNASTAMPLNSLNQAVSSMSLHGAQQNGKS